MSAPEAAPLDDCGAPAGGRAYWLHAADGVRLRLAHWPGERSVLILPGRTEHVEKYGLVVSDLAARGWGVLVLDWRGQGLSDRLAEDAALGHVGAFSDYQLDLSAALALAKHLAPGPLPWITHSMGGCIAMRALVNGHRPPAVAFCAPMWGLALPVATQLSISALSMLTRPLGRDSAYVPTTGPEFGLPSLVFDDNPLTNDKAQFDRIQAQIRNSPEVAIGGPSLRWSGLALAETAALAREPSPPVRALIGLGGNERIVSPEAIRNRAARWPQAELVEYPDAEHELLMECPEVRTDLLDRIMQLLETELIP